MADKVASTKKLVIFALGTGLTSILSRLCERKIENYMPKVFENYNKECEDVDGRVNNPQTALGARW